MSRYKALQISAEKHHKAKVEASRRGISIKELIETAIDNLIDQQPKLSSKAQKQA